MAETLEARLRIVTPMFLGGAAQDTSDGIRPPSLKGALRFWWRALNWGRLRVRAASDADALKDLHSQEARLFGIAADDTGGGQGCFLLRTSHVPLTSSKQGSVHGILKTKPAARYLGYGLVEAFARKNKGIEAGQLIRSCIDEGQDLTVQLRFRRQVEPSVEEAVIAWGLLGGLGSRVRHGFGSVSLLGMTRDSRSVWSPPEDSTGYRTMVSDLIAGVRMACPLSPFTAVCADSRIDILLDHGKSSFDVLNAFGYNLLMYRSWGKDGQVLDEETEANFRADHDWSKGIRPPGFHPRRVVFGLPHNYGKGQALEVKPADHERRASPLFFHVHQVQRHFTGVGLCLPSVFLPPGERINAGGALVASNPDWSVLTDFLDGSRRSDGRPRFPGKVTL